MLLHHLDLGVLLLLLEVHRHLLEVHLYLDKNLLLDLVLRQVPLGAHFNNHNQLLEAICLALPHRLVQRVNRHLVALAHLLLDHRRPQHLELQAPLPLARLLVQPLEVQGLALECPLLLLLGLEGRLVLQVLPYLAPPAALRLVLIAPLPLGPPATLALVLPALHHLALLALQLLALLALQLLGCQVPHLLALLVLQLLVLGPVLHLVNPPLLLEALPLDLLHPLLVARVLHLEHRPLRQLLGVVALGSQLWGVSLEEVELFPTALLQRQTVVVAHSPLESWSLYLPYRLTKTKVMRS